MQLKSSELVLNPDGTVYHLHLHPAQIADTIITVGDPDRVGDVSKYFDVIEHKVQKREFVTHTGRIGNQSVTVISTGVGTDNIDIVLNELDALVNIDLEARTVKSSLKSLRIIRIGTSGTLHSDIPCGSFVLSEFALGLDGLLPFYAHTSSPEEILLKQQLEEKVQLSAWQPIPSYIVGADKKLLVQINVNQEFIQGVTATCTGFYAPQGRSLRAIPKVPDILDRLATFQYENQRVTNFEMETAGIYGLAKILGHRALSCNAILANRATGEFETAPAKVVDTLIKKVLALL